MKKHHFILIICFAVYSATIKSHPPGNFPRVEGWKINIDTVVYNKSNLWEYINGAADIYLAYDFQNLYLAEYSNNTGQSIRVELYKHSSAENAFGIYAAERMINYNFIDAGVQGYIEPDVLNFLTGEYYVKMTSSGKPDVDNAVIAGIAKEISNSLNTENEWPAVIDYFPPEGKLANSENYIAKDFLGYSFFHSAFTADYDVHEKFKMFIIKLKSENEVQDMLESYIKLLNEDKIAEENNIYIINDLFNGMVFLLVKSNYIIGVISTNNKDLAIEYINKIKAKI